MNSFPDKTNGFDGTGCERKTSRPCFQGRDADIPWCHLSSPAIHKHRPRRVRAVSSGKTPIPLRCNGRAHHSLGRAAGPRVRYAAPRCYSTPHGGFVLRPLPARCKTKYLFLHPFSAAGILCNISRYLLVLFTALSGMIVAWLFFAVNTELWGQTARCPIAAPAQDPNPNNTKDPKHLLQVFSWWR